jgi:hypothetical protein
MPDLSVVIEGSAARAWLYLPFGLNGTGLPSVRSRPSRKMIESQLR